MQPFTSTGLSSGTCTAELSRKSFAHKQQGRLKAAPAGFSEIKVLSPCELDFALHDAVPSRILGRSEVRAAVLLQRTSRVKAEVQARITGDERIKWMVQEVVAREAELKLLGLRCSPIEVLEHRQISVKESRPG